MSITNYSFENAAASPAPSGRPLGWTVTEADSYIEYADFSVFGASPDEGYPRETFEIGWPDADQELIAAFDDDNFELAIFDVGPAQQLVEDFENNWGSPQGSFEISSLDFAEFDSLDYEAFESDWGTIIYSFATTDLSFAAFAANAYEEFEAYWRNNESSYVQTLILPTYTFASFAAGATSYAYEAFESSVFDRFFSVDVTANTIELAAHDFLDENIVYVYPYNDESTLPAPLEEDTPYFVLNKTTDDFELEEQIGDGAIDITTAGTGTFKVKADYSKYWTEELEI
jgi:hypothetical protein